MQSHPFLFSDRVTLGSRLAAFMTSGVPTEQGRPVIDKRALLVLFFNNDGTELLTWLSTTNPSYFLWGFSLSRFL